MMVELRDLGEREVVRRIVESVGPTSGIGPGDDAAAVPLGDQYLVVSTDLISGAGHMPEGMTHREMGWMVAAVNYSDIAAMGAEPLGLVMALALPPETELSALEGMMRGAEECSSWVGGGVLGGDTKESPHPVLTGTAVGLVDREGILLRSGAREGDLLAVTGYLGRAAAGMRALEADLDFPEGREALLTPRPRVREGRLLSAHGATSCMDVSDGLSSSVHQLSAASGVGFQVDWESLPVDRRVIEVIGECGASLEESVLHYGGDYQLLFTLPPSKRGEMEEALGDSISIIGRAGGSENLLRRGGEIFKMENRGYEHFG
ncbi:MAG: thiamine-phosphate kinase [Methanomassiliicoccales archaeon]